MNRLKWWRGTDRRYLFTFAFRRSYRCAHVNRFGISCFRPWTYDHWCGMHNTICDTGSNSNKHDKTHRRERGEDS